MGEKKSFSDYIYDLFGHLNMSWLTVILMAVISAVITAVFLIVPAFEETSFHRMGVYLEAWIFLAVIIMSNCKTPLESALKTFVFFLISQPLIYLIQVPFSSMGWQLFNYYGYWFKLTLLTFPAAYIGWYITKENWLSVVILIPVLAFLGLTAGEGIKDLIQSFPKNLIMVLFCIAQIVLYIWRFMPSALQRTAAAVFPVVAIGMMLISPSGETVAFFETVPDEVVYSEAAEINMEVDNFARVQFVAPEEGRLYITATKEGKTEFYITDEGKTDTYILEIVKENGELKPIITKKE